MKSYLLLCLCLSGFFTIKSVAQCQLRIGAGVVFDLEKYRPDVVSSEGRYHSSYGNPHYMGSNYDNTHTSILNVGYFKMIKESLSLGITLNFPGKSLIGIAFSNYADTLQSGAALTIRSSQARYVISKKPTDFNIVMEKDWFHNKLLMTSASLGFYRSPTEVELNLSSTSLIDSNAKINEVLRFNTIDYNLAYKLSVGLKIKKKALYFIPSVTASGFIFPTYYGAEYYRIKSFDRFLLGGNIQIGIEL